MRLLETASPAALSSAVLHSADGADGLSAAGRRIHACSNLIRLAGSMNAAFPLTGLTGAHWGGSLGLTGAGFGADYGRLGGHRSNGDAHAELEHLRAHWRVTLRSQSTFCPQPYCGSRGRLCPAAVGTSSCLEPSDTGEKLLLILPSPPAPLVCGECSRKSAKWPSLVPASGASANECSK